MTVYGIGVTLTIVRITSVVISVVALVETPLVEVDVSSLGGGGGSAAPGE